MKKLSILSLILICALAAGRAQDTLLIFHPTAYNLELFQSMHARGILDLENIHLLGIYHEDEKYSYEQTETYIAETRDSLNPTLLSMSLKKLSGKPQVPALFRDTLWYSEFTTLFKTSIGAVFLGGPDIPPAIYGEETHLLTSVTDPYRHYMELSFLFHLLGGDQNPQQKALIEQHQCYAVLGICLGMQTMHVATGGHMVQDIPSELYGIWTAEKILSLERDQMHRNYKDRLLVDCERPTSYHFHHVDIRSSSILGKVKFAATDPLVLSSHHQSLQEPYGPWKISAWSMDGTIPEAIVHNKFPSVLGVQFHPEKPGLFDPLIQQQAGCGETINFREEIADNASFQFHLGFWELFEELLKKSARKR